MNFSDLNLNTPLINALDDQGITTPTVIQERAFSVIMSGVDVVGIAQTGTGKTLAYLLPCLRQWKFDKKATPKILILVPTRELVVQVTTEIEKLTAYMNVRFAGVYGGTNIKTHIKQINDGVDIVVGTPGRVYDLAMHGVLKFKSIKKLVIDEVDEMLNLGFKHQLSSILEILPAKRQNLMFSATLTEDVELMIIDYFDEPARIEAAPSGTPLENIEQHGYAVPNFNTKVNLLKYLLESNADMKRVLVFLSTKKFADRVFEELEPVLGESVGVIHSNKAQNNRFNTVKKFQDGELKALVATDIVARGIDISEVSHVINFDLPEVPENYIHRIGRTGRADKKGLSIAFYTEKEQEFKTAIEGLMNKEIPTEAFPEDVSVSSELIPEEIDAPVVKNVFVKTPKEEETGPAFHEKLEKNKKTRIKITRAQQMRNKYGKPKTRGQKKKR